MPAPQTINPQDYIGNIYSKEELELLRNQDTSNTQEQTYRNITNNPCYHPSKHFNLHEEAKETVYLKRKISNIREIQYNKKLDKKTDNSLDIIIEASPERIPRMEEKLEPPPTFESVYQDIMSLSSKDQKKIVKRLNNTFNIEVTTITIPQELSPEYISEAIKSIPLWEGKKKSGSAIEWLENKEHYGKWLKHINNDKDYIYRQDILDHDEKLVIGIKNQLSNSDIKNKKYMRTRTEKIDDKKETKNIDTDTVQISIALKQREYRADNNQ